MRIVSPITVLFVAAGAVALGQIGDVETISERLPFAEKASEADVAVEIRCGDLDSWKRRACEDELTARFAAGNATPEAVLRMHCTRTNNVWDQSLPQPPALCAARYGGWISS
jgi:hypothetical protein